MGISGLLPFVKKASREVNVKSFAGATVAVDAYCWLHKGAFSCADKLGKGEKTDGYVQFCVKMVNSILAAGLTPILVFDGRNLPSKSVTDLRRREMKSKNRKLAKSHLLQGNLREARECFQRCVEITPQMALEAIQACRKLGVDCIVAPYEADAQLAYLNNTGIAQIVITEDSDLILFGCNRVLYKMDVNGNGILFESYKLHLCMGVQAENFTFEKFRYMCILSGCDYLPSLPGIGLGKSCKFFSKATNPDLTTVLPKIPIYLKMPNLIVSAEYIEGFIQANNTFLYQLVFDPMQRKLVPLNPYAPDLNPEMMTYAGMQLEDDVAYHLALGNIDLDTMEIVDNFNPEVDLVRLKSSSWSSKPSFKSIWTKNYLARNRIIEEVAPSNPLELSKSSRVKPAAQKRIFTELKREPSIQLSEKYLTELYGHAKKAKIDSDDVELPLSSPITCSEYFPMSKEVPDVKSSPKGTTASQLPEIDDLTLGSSTKTPQKSATPESMDFQESSPTLAANISSPPPTSAVEPVTPATPRGRLLFDRAMTARTPLSSVVELNSAKNSPGSFSGQWTSLRSLYSFTSAGDRSTVPQKSPSNHTAFKSVVFNRDSLSPKTQTCNFNSCGEEDVSPRCSQNDSKFSSSSSPPSGREDSNVQQIRTPNSSSKGLPLVNRDEKRKIVHMKCRAPGLSRKKLTTSQPSSTPKTKQLSLKETLARFNYQKTRP